MKKIIYTAAIAVIAIVSSAKAQVSIGINIGVPVAAPVVVAPAAPVWVPAGAVSPYYYFPDINCYYDMGIGQYIYFENNRWLYSRAIPPRFAGYNFRGARMVPMNSRAFMGSGIPAYGGGRPFGARNNYVMENPRWNNGNRFGQVNGNGYRRGGSRESYGNGRWSR